MKIKSFIWLLFVAISTNLIAQTPEKINYQAIVRDVNNTVVANQTVGVKFTITETTPTGTVIYEETQNPTTNSHGLINLKIGTGAFITGTLSAIDWSANSYYLTTSIDPAGGTNYTLTGVSELVSVPYALHAKTVENADDADADPTNEIQDLQLVGNDLSITNNGTATVIDLTPYLDNTDTQLTEAEVDAFANNNGYLTSFTEVDGDPTNEIELPTGGTNGQVLQTDGSGNYTWVNQTVDTDTQLAEAEVDAFANNNGYLTSFTEVDGDPTNEIELPTGGTNGQVLQTDGSGNYTWVNQTVDTDTQLSEAAVDAFANNNGYLTSEVDGSITNEIQTLSITGSDLSISGGNTITLPSSSAPTFAIGQHYQGGIIVFIDSTGLHGLIVAESDLGSYQYQSDGPTQTSATDFNNGQTNTATLAAASGTYNAADACAAYTGGGFTDWYLPSYTEFIIIYNNLYVLSGFNFASAIYWTSTTTTVFGGANAASFYLSGSGNLNQAVGTFSLVRPVRQF